jgi:hypothetical protein
MSGEQPLPLVLAKNRGNGKPFGLLFDTKRRALGLTFFLPRR